jgi:hypothetical protein
MWVKLSDTFAEDPRWLRLGSDALALHVAALCWCGRALTNGELPRAMVRRLWGIEDADAIAKQLVAEGFWSSTQDGFAIVDYLNDQPSRQQVLDLRAKRVAAGRIGGKKSSSRRKPPDAQARASTRAQASASTRAQAGAEPPATTVASDLLEPRPDASFQEASSTDAGEAGGIGSSKQALAMKPTNACGDPRCDTDRMVDYDAEGKPTPCPVCRPTAATHLRKRATSKREKAA